MVTATGIMFKESSIGAIIIEATTEPSSTETATIQVVIIEVTGVEEQVTLMMNENKTTDITTMLIVEVIVLIEITIGMKVCIMIDEYT